MYETAVALRTYDGAPACHEGIYTIRDHLFYMAVEILIYQERQRLGINIYARPFYPLKDCTENNNTVNSDITENEETKQDKQSNEANNIKINNNITNIKNTNNTNQNKININIKDIKESNKQIEDDWVEVKKTIKTKIVGDIVQRAYIKHLKNRYQALSELEEDNEVNELRETIRNDTKREEKVIGNNKKKEERLYNVNKVPLDILEEVICNQCTKKTQDQCNNSYEEDDVESISNTDSMDSTSKEQLASEILHDDLNLEVDFGKGWKNNVKTNVQKENEDEDDTTSQNKDNTDETMEDIQVVPLELLDEAEAKLQASVINKERLRNENSKLLREIEANDLKNTQKISSLEMALKQKTELLIAALKDKGEIHKRRKGSVEIKRRSV